MKHTPTSRKIEKAWKEWLHAFGIPVTMTALRKTMHVAFEAGYRSALGEAGDEVAQAQRRAQEAAKETRTRVVRGSDARSVDTARPAKPEQDRSGSDREPKKKRKRPRSAGHGRRDAAQARPDGDVQV